jgi:ATP-dependent protease Clp ATPase subunit
MFRRKSETGSELRCSFCHKAKDDVGHLISSPSDYPRAYICDECVAVCKSILSDQVQDQNDDSHDVEPEADASPITVDADGNLSLRHPHMSELIAALSAWVTREGDGLDASKELAAVRRLATLIFGQEPST